MERKVCFKCGIEKDLSEFYVHPRMKDGHLNKCKECTKRDAHERIVLHPEIVRAYEKKRYSDPKRKECVRRHVAQWSEKYPERKKASNMVNNAVRDGRLLKPDKCEMCNKEGKLHGHHYDYSKPLDVIWLCPECHAQIQ